MIDLHILKGPLPFSRREPNAAHRSISERKITVLPSIYIFRSRIFSTMDKFDWRRLMLLDVWIAVNRGNL